MPDKLAAVSRNLTAYRVMATIVGLLLVVLIFGWTGGKLLVSQSYADAKVKAKEMKDSRRKGDEPTGDGEPAEGA